MISLRGMAVLFLWAIWLTSAAAADGAPALAIDPDAPHITIDGHHLDLLNDPEQAYDVGTLLSGGLDADFVTGSTAVPIFQNVSGTIWARLRLKNVSSRALDRSLVVEFANFQRMVVYVPTGNTYLPRELDVRRHLRDTDYGYRYPSYAITLPPESMTTVFIAISSYSARFPLHLWQNEALERFALQEFWLQGLLFGIVLCALAYQIAFTVLARQSEHWSLSLCIVLTSLMLLTMLGYQHVYLGRLGDWMTRAYPSLLCAMAGSIALFTRHFLLLDNRLPRIDIALRGLQWLYFGAALLAVAAPAKVTSIFAWIVLAGFVLVLTALVNLARTRDSLATLYAISFAPIVVTGVYGSLVNARLVTMPEHYHTLIASGFALGLLMFAFSSAYRIGQVRKEQRLLRNAKRNAEDRARIQAEFLANMSHEVRTPLNAVIGTLDLLDRHADDPAQQKRISTALAQSRILLDLFDQALDFARIEAVPLEVSEEPFAPEAIVDEVIEMVAMRAREKGLALTHDVDSHVPSYLLGDGPKLQQILLNLISNAIKFTDHGRVSLRVGLRSPEDTGNDRLRVDIEDTGIGISAAAQTRIFDRFVQADDTIRQRFGGTGLGLSIARTLVEALGGQIGVTSLEGKGSTFWLEIPLHPCAAPRGEISAPTTDASYSPLRVLVVEDSPINRELVTAMLSEDGHTASCAGNGQEALQQLGAQLFDVVLMDVSMPVIDGIEATRSIRSAEGAWYQDIPILGLTAHAVPEKILTFIEAGMDDVLTKPVRLVHLRTALHGVRLRDSRKSGDSVRTAIDRDIFEAHHKRLGTEKLSRLLTQQFNETREQLQALRSAEAELAPGVLSEEFHRLAGAFLFIGLSSLGDLCRTIEKRAVADEHLLHRLASELADMEAETAKIFLANPIPDGRS